MTERLDLRGVVCPMNYVKAKLFLEGMDPGSETEFLVDDGEAVRSVPRSLRDDGHDVVHLERTPTHYVLRMRRRENRGVEPD